MSHINHTTAAAVFTRAHLADGISCRGWKARRRFWAAEIVRSCSPMQASTNKESVAIWNLFVPLDTRNPSVGDEFQFRIHPDGRCICIDEATAGIHRALGGVNPALRFEFSVECQVPRSLYRRVKVARMLGDDRECEEEASIDRLLASIFWDQVNPKLVPPRHVLL